MGGGAKLKGDCERALRSAHSIDSTLVGIFIILNMLSSSTTDTLLFQLLLPGAGQGHRQQPRVRRRGGKEPRRVPGILRQQLHGGGQPLQALPALSRLLHHH